MARVLIVKAGSAVPEVTRRRRDFEAWIAAAMELREDDVALCRVCDGEALPEPHGVAAVIVTGSPAMVTDREPWSERTAEWLRVAVEVNIPVLGICYGHQLLAHAFGGRVEDNPHGRHIGTVDVQLTEHAQDDALFNGFEPVLHVPVSHLQAVTELPQGATLLARADRDPHHAFKVGDSAWGVQFHPEFDADILRGYVDARRERLTREGLDVDAIKHGARDTHHGPRLLRRFAQLVKRRR